jgi:hypothetical protein
MPNSDLHDKSEPLTDTLKGGPRAPLEPDENEFFVADDPAIDPAMAPNPYLDAALMRHQQHWAGRQNSNPNALRGPQAGPADHPRTVK